MVSCLSLKQGRIVNPRTLNILGLRTQPQNCSWVDYEAISTPERSFSTTERGILNIR